MNSFSSCLKGVLFFLFAFYINILQAQYCSNTSSTPCSYSGISGFVLSNVSNINDTCDADAVVDGYSDYTNLTVYLAPGSNSLASLYIYNTDVFDMATIWIDWNQDMSWSEDELTVFSGNNTFAGPLTAIITVPTTAVTDQVGRLRIVSDFGIQPYDPCGQPLDGEIEDYSFIVTATPAPGGPSTYCPNNSDDPCVDTQIGRFTLANTDNNNGLCDKENLGSGLDDGYSDYTADFLTILNQDTAYTVTVEILNGLVFDFASIWIDWDANGSWSQTEYYPLAGETEGTNQFTAAIVAPSTAVTGKVARIRVISDWLYPPVDACQHPGEGEVEDYSFILLPSGQTIPPCVNLTGVIPSNGSTNQCNRQTLRWPGVNGASYLLTVRDTISNTYIVTNLAVADTFYTIPAPLTPGHVYSWLAKPVLNGIEGYQCDSAYFTTSPNQDPLAAILPAGDTLSTCQRVVLNLNGNPSLGTSPYSTHAWTNDLYGHLSIANTALTNFYADTTGFFKLFYSVTDNNNCFGRDSVVIQVQPLPLKGTLASDKPSYCENDKAKLILSGHTGTISWQDSVSGGSWNALSYTVVNDTTVMSGALTNPTYYRTIVNNGSCSDTSNTVFVDINPLPAAPSVSITGNDSLCPGESAVLNVTNYSSNIVWDDAANTSGIQITVTSAASYTATYTDGNGCKSTTTTVIENNTAEPKPVISPANPGPLCQGETITLTSTGSNLVWGGTVITPTTANTLNATLSGKYVVRSTNAGGCSNVSDSITLVFNSLPPKPVITNSITGVLCDGMTASLTSSGSFISWNTGVTGNTISTTTDGWFVATSTLGSGCKASSDTLTLVFKPRPAKPDINLSTTSPLCDGDVLTLSSSNVVLWSTAVTAASINVTQNGNYFATATNSEGCTQNSDTVAVTFNTIPVTPVLTFGNNRLETNSPAASYKWINVSGVVVANTTDPFYTPNPGGSYRLVVVSAQGCESDTSNTVVASGVGVDHVDPAIKNIFVYPNPSEGSFTLDLGSLQQNMLTCKLLDGTGRVVWKQSLSNTLHSLTLEVEKGCYFLIIDNQPAKSIVIY